MNLAAIRVSWIGRWAMKRTMPARVFSRPDKLGTFRYGSPHVNLVADNTEPETLAATGYDDDGVACQTVGHRSAKASSSGYCTNREVAPKIGRTRSTRIQQGG